MILISHGSYALCHRKRWACEYWPILLREYFEPLITTFSSYQYITLFYVCICLTIPYLVDIVY